MAETSQKFRTTLWSSGGNNVGIVVPEDVVTAFGRGKRVPVVVTIDGDYQYRNTIASMGGKFLISFSAETRKITGRGAGDEVEVRLDVDDTPRTVDVPDDLAAEAGGVATGGQAELAPVLPVELRGAVVAHLVADGGDVVEAGHQEQARAVQTDLLLELHGGQRGHRVELPVEGRRAHAARASEIVDAERLGVVLGDPPDGPADLGHAAVGQPELADGRAQRPGEQPPHDLALEHRCQYGPVGRRVEQHQHADHGVEELGSGSGHPERGRRRRRAHPRRRRAGLEQDRGDGRGAQDEPEPQGGLVRARLRVVAGDRQVDRGDEVLAGPVLVDAVTRWPGAWRPGR